MSPLATSPSPELDLLHDPIFDEFSNTLLGQGFPAGKSAEQQTAVPLMSSYEPPKFEASGHHSSTIPSHPDFSPSPPSSHNFLSPNGDYLSDHFFSELSEHTSPNIDDGFFPNSAFGAIPPAESNTFQRDSYDFQALDRSFSVAPSSGDSLAGTHPSVDANAVSSHLLGLNMSSIPGQTSRTEELQPSNAYAENNRGRIGAATDSTHAQDLPDNHTSDNVQTESKCDGATIISPVVRVESWSRGDSPARVNFPNGISSKRSRTRSRSSSHLSPGGDDECSDSESESERTHHRFQSVPVTPQITRTDTGSWILSASTGQGGVDPETRDRLQNNFVPNFKDQEKIDHLNEIKLQVQEWLAHSEAGSDVEDNPRGRNRLKPRNPHGRSRAKTVGDQPNWRVPNFSTTSPQPRLDDTGIPGPGLLVEEESDGSSSSGPADIDVSAKQNAGSYFPPVGEDSPSKQAPPVKPWDDPPYGESNGDVHYQPPNANAAIMRFRQQADNISYVSRAATIDSYNTRRLSDADLGQTQSLLKRFSFGRERDRTKGGRRSSLLQQAASKLIPRRSCSNLQQKAEEAERNIEPIAPKTSSPESHHRPRMESLSSLGTRGRRPSFSIRPKSPAINTQSAIAAMAGQIAAVGRSGPLSSTSLSPNDSWSHPKGPLKRTRSARALSTGSTLGLAELMTRHGGPPMPTLASPHQDNLASPPPPSIQKKNDVNNVKMEETPVHMPLEVHSVPTIPNQEGFRTHIQNLNPRLEPFLVNRMIQEQVKRYKRLVECKTRHYQQTGVSGPAWQFNPQMGNIISSNSFSSPIDPSPVKQQPNAATIGSGEEEELNGNTEGIITPKHFPQGVPMPPVSQLPAKFQCYLCFKTKEFKKPSDWTKHVHEDVEPFTCTFANCSEPKSFKRKADWVRHENERHRHPEWWACDIPECTHKCYRKDNFVQHLVREHKMAEPKVKSMKEGIVRANGNGSLPSQNGIDEVWTVVERCRQTSSEEVKEECKFCANVLPNWKKLAVHHAKHMEQIAMPVLDLVRNASADTAITPIVDDGNNTFAAAVSPMTPAASIVDQSSLSSYGRMANGSAGLGLMVNGYPQTNGRYTSVQQPMANYDIGKSSAIPAHGTPNPSVLGGFAHSYSNNIQSQGYNLQANHYPPNSNVAGVVSGYSNYGQFVNGVSRMPRAPVVPSQQTVSTPVPSASSHDPRIGQQASTYNPEAMTYMNSYQQNSAPVYPGAENVNYGVGVANGYQYTTGQNNAGEMCYSQHEGF
ncbi:MAG: hypothetical protein M1834_005141 [Cirrosporium novae-zelandiae]|nr:MAG: hypothetical protein M1834_005141 [Cirrosporium novae-zelandiae]